MATVFISHAHDDGVLAQKIASLLVAALGLTREEFFVSSEEGHGVPPAANILETIVGTLRSVPVFIGLLTPKAAARPWVWIEAGNRLGRADKQNPIIVVPSKSFVTLLAPVAGLRCLRLDSEGELLELVQAVGESVGKAPLAELQYRSALDDLRTSCAAIYSTSALRRARVVAWLKAHAYGLVLAAAGLAMLATVGRNNPPQPPQDCLTLRDLNDAIAKTAAGFLVLKGRVTSGQEALHGVDVMVSRDEVQDVSRCLEPACTKKSTTTDGEFTLDLTRINAGKDDPVVLSVAKQGFKFVSRQVDVDVRAMDVGTAPLNVVLSPQ